jgi:streptomycin 6-kinase
MTISIYPDTAGDIILDLRSVDQDEQATPALVAVDAEGNERPLGRIFTFRDGGGHGEVFGHTIAAEIGFDRENERAKIH